MNGEHECRYYELLVAQRSLSPGRFELRLKPPQLLDDYVLLHLNSKVFKTAYPNNS